MVFLILLALAGYLGRRTYVAGSGYGHGLLMVRTLIAVFVVLYIQQSWRWTVFILGGHFFFYLLDCSGG